MIDNEIITSGMRLEWIMECHVCRLRFTKWFLNNEAGTSPPPQIYCTFTKRDVLVVMRAGKRVFGIAVFVSEELICNPHPLSPPYQER